MANLTNKDFLLISIDDFNSRKCDDVALLTWYGDRMFNDLFEFEDDIKKANLIMNVYVGKIRGENNEQNLIDLLKNIRIKLSWLVTRSWFVTFYKTERLTDIHVRDVLFVLNTYKRIMNDLEHKLIKPMCEEEQKETEPKIIDNHNGKEVKYNVVGLWVNDEKKQIGLAIDEMHCINEIYIDKDGLVRLSVRSIGPVVNKEDIERGEKDGWKLIRCNSLTDLVEKLQKHPYTRIEK
jgi:hypothetical protein